MLTGEEKERVSRQFAEFVRDSQGGSLDAARLLLALPPDPEALTLVVQLASDVSPEVRQVVEGLARHVHALAGVSREIVIGPGPSATLEDLLLSSIAYPHKVDALLRAARAREATAAEVVRKLIKDEKNPFVLATMASVLGQLGDPGDVEVLTGLLHHSDPRVIANSLEAIYRQGAQAPLEVLTELAEAADSRIRINALALMARSNPDKVFEIIPPLIRSKDAAIRGGMAYLLGEMVGQSRAVDMLLEMALAEERTPVLKQLAAAVKRHASPGRAAAIIGPLYELKLRTTGAKLAIINMLLQEVAVEIGMVEGQVTRVGQDYVAKKRWSTDAEPPADVPPGPPRSPAAPEGEPPVVGPVPEVASNGAVRLVERRIDPSPAVTRAPSGEPDRGGPPGPTAMVQRPHLRLVTDRPAPATPDALTTQKFDLSRDLAEVRAPRPVQGQSTLSINVADLVEKGDEDLPLSFSSVWGQQPATASGPIAVPKPAGPRGRAVRTGLFAVAGALILLLVGVMSWPSTSSYTMEEPRSVTLRKRQSPKPSFRMKQEPPRSPASRAPVDAYGARVKGKPANPSDTIKIGRLGGPNGSWIDLDGEVVQASAGRVVVRCQNRFYLVRDNTLGSEAVGRRVQIRGTLMGAGRNGLIYVQPGG